MATKTMILRPSYFVDASSDLGLTPSSTSSTDSYMLINEEIADDTSTMISFSSGYRETESEFYRYGFNCPVIKNLSSGNLFFRVSGGTNIKYFLYSFNIIDKNNSIIKTIERRVDCSLSGISNFDNFNETLASDILQYLNNFEGYIEIEIKAYAPSVTKSVSFILTQSYIELEYEENPDKYYIKHNNTWILLSDVFYKKINGSWISTEPSILSEELKYLNNYIE